MREAAGPTFDLSFSLALALTGLSDELGRGCKDGRQPGHVDRAAQKKTDILVWGCRLCRRQPRRMGRESEGHDRGRLTLGLVILDSQVLTGSFLEDGCGHEADHRRSHNGQGNGDGAVVSLV